MTPAAVPPLEFVQLPGLRMGFVQAGSPERPAVLLLHGFPEFHYSWRHQIPAFVNAGYRVVAPDQRGYNQTGKHGPYDVATLASDIRQLQGALGITRSQVVGHDWGACVAYEFAHRFRERVQKLAIMNGLHLNALADHMKVSRTQLRRIWYIFFFQLPWLPERALRSKDYAFLEQLLGRVPGMSAADVARYKHACAQPGALSAMLGWYRAVFRTALRELARPYIRNVPAETLLLWGMRDAALEYGVNDTLPRYVPNLRTHQIASADHWVQLEAPDEVNDVLLSFLAA
jgi:epoxide hydrolase 4